MCGHPDQPQPFDLTSRRVIRHRVLVENGKMGADEERVGAKSVPGEKKYQLSH